MGHEVHATDSYEEAKEIVDRMGQFGIVGGMSQIRVSPDNEELLKELVEIYTSAWGFKVSRTTFANVVMREGIIVMKQTLEKDLIKKGKK